MISGRGGTGEDSPPGKYGQPLLVGLAAQQVCPRFVHRHSTQSSGSGSKLRTRLETFFIRSAVDGWE